MSPKVAPQLRHTRPRAGFGGTGPPSVTSAWAEPGAVMVMRRLPPHLPRAGPSSRAGRMWHLPTAGVRTAVAGASSGRVPLPLWMSGTRRAYPGGSARPGTGHDGRPWTGQDGRVATRIIYTDLDGTMVGP